MTTFIPKAVSALVLLSISGLHALTDITGRVVDQAEAPIQGLGVQLSISALTDTTDENGLFSLNDNQIVSARENDAIKAPGPRLLGSQLFFSVPSEQTHVSIALYDLKGRLAAAVFSGAKPSGQYSADLSGTQTGKLMVLKVQIGDNTTVLKYHGPAVAEKGPAAAPMVKRMKLQAVETLEISTGGKIVYDTAIDVSDTAVSLPGIQLVHFSISGSLLSAGADIQVIRTITNLHPAGAPAGRPVQLPDTTAQSLTLQTFSSDIFFPFSPAMDSCSIYAEVLNSGGQVSGGSPPLVVPVSDLQVAIPAFFPDNNIPLADITGPDSVVIDSPYTLSFSNSRAGVFGSISLRELSVGSYTAFSPISGSDTSLTAPSKTDSIIPIVLRVTDNSGRAVLDTLHIRSVNWWNTGDLNAFDWRDGIIYYLIIDRFSNGDGLSDPVIGAQGNDGNGSSAQYEGGDFSGVTSQIPYIANLGMNTIQITPPNDNQDYASPGTDGHMYAPFFGAWPSPADIDYSAGSPNPLPRAESRFGTMQQLTDMADAVHGQTAANGFSMNLVLDYVMNHVSIGSGLYQAKNADWYVPGNPVCGLQIPWDADSAKFCSFTDYLPAFNFNNQDARSWSHSDALWWAAALNADGLLLDAVNFVTDAWLTEMRTKLSSAFPSPAGGRFLTYSNVFTLSERGLLARYVDPAAALDGQVDLPFRKALMDALFSQTLRMDNLDAWMAENDAAYVQNALMIKTLGTPSTARAIHYASGELSTTDFPQGWTPSFSQPAAAVPYKKLELAYAVIFTNPGIPLVFYGDEIGLAGGGSPDNQRIMPNGDGSLNAFQLGIRSRLSRLGNIRNTQKSLTRGFRTTLNADADTWAYRMGGLAGGAPDIIVVLNRSASPLSVDIPAGSYTDLVSSTAVTGGSLVLEAYGYRIMKQTE